MHVGIRTALLSALLAFPALSLAAGGEAGAGATASQPSSEQADQGPDALGEPRQDNSGPDVVGNLIDVSPAAETIKVRDPQTNHVVELQLQDETRLEVDGQPASLNDLREGEPIRASFELVGDEMVAQSVSQGAPKPVEQSATGAIEEPAVTIEDLEFEGPSPRTAGPNPVEMEQ